MKVLLKKFLVQVQEIHYSYRYVEAKDEAEAKLRAPDAPESELEYSHCTQSENWKVEELDEFPEDAEV